MTKKVFDICPFCNERPASKENSHIISNFLTTSVKSSPKGNRLVKIIKPNPLGRYEIKQDSSKENYIFCPECEAFFNTEYERYISNTFHKAYLTNRYYFNVFLKSQDLFYRVYTNTDYVLFKKFLLLQLYRTHVSKLDEFVSTKLSVNQLKSVHENLTNKSFFEDIRITVFATNAVKDKTTNVLCATPVSATSYFIWMNEFLCVYEFDRNKSTIPEVIGGSNFLNNSPRVVFVDLATWRSFINTLIDILQR